MRLEIRALLSTRLARSYIDLMPEAIASKNSYRE
jgi:hypothetical protein